MTVKDFIALEKAGAMFTVVNANRVGYMTNPQIVDVADCNVIGRDYGEYELVGFEPVTKRNIKLYVKFPCVAGC